MLPTVRDTDGGKRMLLERISKVYERFQEVPTDQRATEQDEGRVDTIATLIADIETTKTMEPGQCPFDDPPCAAQSAAVRRSSLGELRLNPAAMEQIAMALRVIAAVALDERRFAHGSAGAAAQRGDGVHQGDQLGDVVPIGGGHNGSQGNAFRFGENVMFRPGLTAIGWVRSSFFPPRNARSEPLSTTAQLRSSRPRRRNSASNTSCSRCHTPARCQATSRRQQVLPEPQPISRGNSCHGSPACSTNRMPVNAARSEIRGRPMRRPRRRRGFGRSGSIRAHNRSSRSGRDMPDRTNAPIKVQEATH